MSNRGFRSRFMSIFRSKDLEPIVNLEGDLDSIMRHLEYYAYDKLLGNNGLGNRLREFMKQPQTTVDIMSHMNWSGGAKSYSERFLRRYFDLIGSDVIETHHEEGSPDKFSVHGSIKPLDEVVAQRLQQLNQPFLLAGEDLIDIAIDSIFANRPLGAFREISVGAIWDSLQVDTYLMQFRLTAFDFGLEHVFDKPMWRILEIGTGNGVNIPHILQNAVNLGIDVSLTLIEYSPVLMYRAKAAITKFLDDNSDLIKSQNLTITINYIQEDILSHSFWENANLANNSFDIVFLVNMMQNLSPTQTHDIFAQINNSVLCEEGKIIIANFFKGEKHKIFDILYNVTENYFGLPTIYHIDILLHKYFRDIQFDENVEAFSAVKK